MASNKYLESDITSWLEIILEKHKLEDISVEISGNAEQGDGYLGDIIFAVVKAVSEDKSPKLYNVVIKCSQQSQALRETCPVKDAFLNEIFFYENVMPTLLQFQKDKGIKDCFDFVPRYFGSLCTENKEIAVLENLKVSGYKMWPRKQALPAQYADLVVETYAKFHATSLALRNENPKKIQKIVDGFYGTISKLVEAGDVEHLFGNPIDEGCALLKNILSENTLTRWRNLKTQIFYIFCDIQKEDAVKVFLHGDCWNNNLMFLHDANNDVPDIPSNAMILDWQFALYGSPILDLSYFLFACLSKESLENLNNTLTHYHRIFVNSLKELKVEKADDLYPFDDFMRDWVDYGKYGLVLAGLMLKVACTDQDEIVDVVQNAEAGTHISKSFSKSIRDQETFKNRIRPAVEYAAKYGLI